MGPPKPAFRQHMVALLMVLLLDLTTARMAIVRPFAVHDHDQIILSFKPWEDLLPCTKAPSIPVDLFVYFSQSYATDSLLWSALMTFAADFDTQKQVAGKWQNCFRNFHVAEAGLTPEQDTYDIVQAGNISSNWVEGPNRQFLAMAQAFQTGKWGHYDTWYLMEMDSIPSKRGWMNSLLDEVQSKAPFSILGSSFRGDRWDMFQTTLPATLLLHVNGNAVYNISHPLFQYFISELDKDSRRSNFTVAFDVRIAELFLEAMLTEEEYNSYRWDSTTIGNYAATTMLPKYITTESIVHGAKFFAEWLQPTALVVSDWGQQWNGGSQTALEHFLQTLQVGNHPFREIVVLRPPAMVQSVPSTRPTNGGNMTITQQAREGSDWLDWCNAQVQSPWFMYTNVNFDFSRRIDLLQGIKNQLPVATYVPQDSTYCNAECSFSVNRANQFVGSKSSPAMQFFLLKDTLFNTNSRNSFCASWASWNASQVKPQNVCDPLPGPTATDYMTFLNTQSPLENTYDLLNAVKWGQREHGLIMEEIPQAMNSGCSFPAMNANASTCYTAPSNAPQLLPPGCSWRPGFGTAFEGSTVLVPRYTATVRYATCAYTDWILPTIDVSNNEGQSLTFEVSTAEPFSLPYKLIVVPGNDLLSIQVTPSRPLGTGASVAGTLTLTSLFNGASIVKVVPFNAYNGADLTVQLADNKLKVGDKIHLTGSGSQGSVIQLQVPSGFTLEYLFPSQLVDGWVQSSDAVVPNHLVLGTKSLPAEGITLSLIARQTRTSTFGDTFARCWDLQVNLTSNVQTPCSGKLTLSQTTAESDSIIQASLSPLTANFDNSDTVDYEWSFDSQSPVSRTSVSSAVLTVPFILASAGGKVMVNVKATDSYGRNQICSVTLNVTMPDLQQAAAQAGCTSGGTDQADMTKCLGISSAALSSGGDVTFAQNLLSAVLSQGTHFVPKSSEVTNQLLSNLAVIGTKIPPEVLNDELQSQMVDMLDNLVSNAPLSDSSADVLLSLAGPMLTSIVSMSVESNSTSAQEKNGEGMMTVLDKAFASLACMSKDLFEMKGSVVDGCIDAQWGTQTSDSSGQDYGKGGQTCSISADIKDHLPQNICLQVVQYTNGCNPLGQKLQSTQNLSVIKVYDATTREPVSLDGLALNVMSVSIFSATDTAQSSRLLRQDAKFQVQSTANCIALDVNGDPVDSTFNPATSTCSSSTFGSITAATKVAANTSSPSPSSSPSPPLVRSHSPISQVVDDGPVSQGVDDGTSALAIGLGVGLGLGVPVFLAVSALLVYSWMRHLQSGAVMEGIFEGRGIVAQVDELAANTPTTQYEMPLSPQGYSLYGCAAPPLTPVI